MEGPSSAQEQFTSPEEEREALQERSREREKQIEASEGAGDQERATREVVQEYAAQPSEEVLSPQFQDTDEGRERLALDLAPEEHDDKMAEFIELVREKGIKNTLDIIERMNSPHLEDDFHRFLVQYIQQGYEVEGLKPKSGLSRALHHTLFEVTLPPPDEEEGGQRSLSQLLSSMEQFFAGMRSLSSEGDMKGNPYFAIELAKPEGSDQYSFFVSIPNDRTELFEKQISSIYPDAEVSRAPDDYNIFNEDGVAVGSIAIPRNYPIYPIKTYESFEHDPLNVILNSFSNVQTEGEGAAVQLIFSAERTDKIAKSYQKAVEAMQDGKGVKEAFKEHTSSGIGGIASSIAKEVGSGLLEFASIVDKKNKGDEGSDNRPEQAVMEELQKKVRSNVYKTTVRLVASSHNNVNAKKILADMEASFNQFENQQGNSFQFKRLEGGRLRDFLHDYAYRIFSDKYSMPLTTEEITTVIHFETLGLSGQSKLKETKGKQVPAPPGLPSEGIVLGVNRHRNTETEIRMAPKDRLRHFYVIGQTGTGKTALLKNMITQDIKNGEGICFIDPHGSDVQDILANVPKERAEDVIYFDPSYTARPMSLNMLEYDHDHDEQKTFVVDELFKIFQKLYSNVPESMGPMFEQYFRNAALLVVEDPESGSTMLDISRVLSDDDFRNYKLSRSKNPVVNQFWEGVAGKAGGESSLQNIVPYITSKFDVFMSNEIMRPIIAQERSSFNFRDVMDNRKILLVNLAKGTLGDMNSNLLGLIIVGKILMATLSRVDAYGQDPAPFYLYIDEFQNVTTDSISTILSEARKYKLGLNIAHQFTAQLEEGIKDSVFGNVGSMCSFRVGAEDSEVLEPQFQPTVDAEDFVNVQNFNAYLRMLVNGEPVKPFSLSTLPPEEGDPQQVEKLKQLSYLTYGEDRETVEKRIRERYGMK